jgi:thymidylate synthase|tara:strand:- start:11440 stop:12168 length:729 start_codon:yes stop_codon:yes gene_type:complete
MSKNFSNITEAFEHIYDDVMSNGVNQNNTKALYNYMFTIRDISDKNVYTKWRKFNNKYAEKEWKWYLSGNPNAEEISIVAKIWKNHMDENGNVNSNYGYQWNRNKQLNYVIKELKNNKYSRRAVISLYDGKEHNKYSKDTPCTLSIHFYFIPNDDNLHCTVSMRSNDVFYGLCNDFYCFAKLQELIASNLNVKTGSYTHLANNMHVYDRHFKYHKNNNKKFTNVFYKLMNCFSNIKVLKRYN